MIENQGAAITIRIPMPLAITPYASGRPAAGSRCRRDLRRPRPFSAVTLGQARGSCPATALGARNASPADDLHPTAHGRVVDGLGALAAATNDLVALPRQRLLLPVVDQIAHPHCVSQDQTIARTG